MTHESWHDSRLNLPDLRLRPCDTRLDLSRFFPGLWTHQKLWLKVEMQYKHHVKMKYSDPNNTDLHNKHNSYQT